MLSGECCRLTQDVLGDIANVEVDRPELRRAEVREVRGVRVELNRHDDIFNRRRVIRVSWLRLKLDMSLVHGIRVECV